MTAAPDPRALLDALDEAHAKATPGEWRDAYGDVRPVETPNLLGPAVASTPEGANPADAAAIVAEHNAFPALTAAVRGALDLADELDAEAAERDRMADRLPDQPAYRMEINRLVVGAKHQARAARRIRSTVTAALTGGQA